MNFKRSKLSSIVCAVVGSMSLPVASVSFAEEEVEKVEKVQVTGSRISRAEYETATPVKVISGEEIIASGEVTVAQYLQSLPGNSFGSFRPSSGSSFQSQALVGLRGLGSSRTLILLNGRRFAPSPTADGAAVNLNSIPSSAIERVEVLKDGASAVYGSDAIAGVINIILKDDFEGGKAFYQQGSPITEGGDEKTFGFMQGITGDKGNLLFSFERDTKGYVADRDRDYLSPRLSINSRNYGSSFYAIPGSVDEDGNCALAGEGSSFATSTDVDEGDPHCRYRYTDQSLKTASVERDTFFITGNYDLTDSITFSSQAILQRNRSFGRFAPAAGSFTINPGISDFHDAFLNNVPQDRLNEDGSARVNWRFDDVGTRDSEVTDNTFDINLGLTGSHEVGFLGSVDWYTNYNHTIIDSKSIGKNYGFGPGVDAAISAGYLFNEEGELYQEFDENGQLVRNYGFSRDGIRLIGADTYVENEMIFNSYAAGASWLLGNIGGRDIGWSIGSEFTYYEYQSLVDDANEDGHIIGSSGSSAEGDRDVKAVFAETSLPLAETLDLSLAARYDKYSDFGSANTGQARLSFRPIDTLLLRASYGKGFRAPSLSSLHSGPGFSADRIKDPTLENAPTYQVDTTRLSNLDLKAEKSDNINFGIVLSAIPNVDVTLDFYDITIKDKITLPSLSDWAQFESTTGQSSPFLRRDPNSGRAISADRQWVNFGELHTSGFDFSVNYKDTFAFGTISSDFSLSYIFEWEEDAYPGGPIIDKAGQRDGISSFPEYRAKAGVNYMPPSGNQRIRLSTDYVASYADDTVNFENIGSTDHYQTWNVDYNVKTPWDSSVSVGFRNLTDEEPVQWSDGDYNEDLFSLDGRTFYFRVEQNF